MATGKSQVFQIGPNKEELQKRKKLLKRLYETYELYFRKSLKISINYPLGSEGSSYPEGCCDIREHKVGASAVQSVFSVAV